MKKQKLVILFSILTIGLIVGIFQYVNFFQTEMAVAYNATKPANGHSWSEMQCTSDLCVTSGKVGIGTDTPSNKLDVAGNVGVAGNVTASGDICNGTGNCLSALATLTNACGNAAKNYVYSATSYSGTYCVMGSPTPVTPDFPNQGSSKTWTCPVTSDPTHPISCTATRDSPPPPPPTYLIGGVHTTAQCSNVATVSEGKICNFSAASCPIGWTQYQSYTATTAVTGNYNGGACGYCCTYAWCLAGYDTCTTGFHSTLSNSGVESCRIIWLTPGAGCGSCSYNHDIYATVTNIGCY